MMDRLPSFLPRRRRLARTAATLAALLLASGLAASAQSAPAAPAPSGPAPATPAGTLFPQPLRIEHQLVVDEGEAGRFVSEPVVDTYGGTWIVSERPDGSRLVVDLARRTLTEVRPGQGTYSELSFDRYAELRDRLAAVQLRGEGRSEAPAEREISARERPERESPARQIEVREIALAERGSGGGSIAGRGQASLRHLRAREASGAGPGLDVWVDPALRLTPAALRALSDFDAAVAGPGGPAGPDGAAGTSASPGELLAAVREQAGGALPLHTRRQAPGGAVYEDRALAAEVLDAFPLDLVEIPEGLRRTPHPLELSVSFEESEAELREALSGAPGSGSERDGEVQP